MRHKKTTFALLLLLTALALAWFFLPAQLVADSLMNPGGGGQSPLPEPALSHESFEANTSDDVTIRGWFFPASAEAHATVVVCHGVGSSRSGALGLAESIHSAGDLNVIAFDFRGHGDSERVQYTYGARETHDVQAVVDWARERAPDLPVSLVAWSAGAATALLYAATDPDLRSLVLINPFADMREMALRRRPFFVREATYETALGMVEHDAGFLLSDVSPIGVAPAIQARTLFIVGESDATIPPEHSRRLHRAMPSSSLWALPGVGHNNWWRHPDFGQRVRDFLHQR